MSYQDRKDIDTLYNLIWDNEKERLNFATISQLEELLSQIRKIYDKSEVEEIATELDNSLNSLDTSLTNLLTNLNEFNDALFHLDEDNIDLETDLSELADNLGILSGMLDEFNGELYAFQQTLDGFGVQLNGDANHEGFQDKLTALQTTIGSDTNPSPTSLKGMLNAFGEQLQQVAQGDNALALSLSALSGYLTKFQGTLAEFKAQIESDLGQSVYDGLDQQVINLIYSIASTQQDISDHQDSLDDLNDTIGESTDVLADGTLYGVLNNTSSVASSASSTANSVSDTINNTINRQISSLDTASTNIKNKIGYDSIGNTNLQSQITSQGNTIGTSSDSASANTLFGKVKNAQNTADAVDTRVGTSSSTSTSTVFGSLNQTISDLSDVQTAIGDVSQISTTLVNDLNDSIGEIEDVQNVMYKGTGGNHSDSATPTNPATGSFCKVIKTDVGTAQSTANTAQSTANTAQSTADSAQTTANSVNTKVGTVDVQNDGSLAKQMGKAKTRIGIHDYNFAQLFDPSDRLDFAILTNIPQNEWASLMAKYETDYGISTNKFCWYSQSSDTTYYYKIENGVMSMFTPTTPLVGVRESLTGMVLPMDGGMEYAYILDTNTYYKFTTREVTQGVYENIWLECDAVIDFFDRTRLYDAVDDYFAKIIPSMAIQDSFTAFGVTVKWYTDGLYVYVTATGNLQSGTMPKESNSSDSSKVIPSNYRPPVKVKSPIAESSDGYQLEVGTNGVVKLWGNTSSTTAVATSVMYPLRSRMIMS